MSNRQERRAADNASKTVPRAVHERVVRSLAALTVQQSALDKRFAAHMVKHSKLQRSHDELSQTVERYRGMSVKQRIRTAIRILRSGCIV